MRRDIIRYPVGQQFRKILEDDHEWYIITDIHLNILAAKRGEESYVSSEVIENTFKDVKQKSGKNIPIVYVLHSHPGLDNALPSWEDVGHFVREKGLQYHYKVKIRGQGIITKKGIFIMKLPEKWRKLDYLDNRLHNIYKDKTIAHVNNQLSVREWDDALTDLKTKSSEKYIETMAKAHKSAIKATIKDIQYPHIGKTTIRRTHRFNMRRRR